MGGRGSLPWKYKQRYLFTKYVHKQGNCILESLRHRDLDSPRSTYVGSYTSTLIRRLHSTISHFSSAHKQRHTEIVNAILVILKYQVLKHCRYCQSQTNVGMCKYVSKITLMKSFFLTLKSLRTTSCWCIAIFLRKLSLTESWYILAFLQVLNDIFLLNLKISFSMESNVKIISLKLLGIF